MPFGSWTKEQVEELLRKEQFRYQRIELPFGLATAGQDRSSTAVRIFPDNLAGKSVLDLGCSSGYFCFEAAKRGAKRVLGIDVEPDVIRKNRLLADCLGLNVEFQAHDIEATLPDEQFDYVLCLNVLHHLVNPLSVLDNLVKVTREHLVLEMASLGTHDQRWLSVFPFLGPVLAGLPLIYVNADTRGGRRKLKKYFMTKSAVRNILLHHRHAFGSVNIVRSEHKGRFIAIAERQNISELLVVAGPPGVGKAEFLRALVERRLDADVAEALGPSLGDGPIATLKETGRAKIDRAVLPYDIFRTYLRSGGVYQRDEELAPLNNAARVTIVTLVANPMELGRRFESSQGRYPRWLMPKRARKIMAGFSQPRRIVDQYKSWLEFVAARQYRHVVVDVSGRKFTVNAPDRWMEEYRATYAS